MKFVRGIGSVPLRLRGGGMHEQDDVDLEQLRQQVIGWLARREHSRQEVRQKLVRRYGVRADLDTLLDQLEESGLLSDRRFAESLTRMRSGRGYGPLRVRAELAAKGVGAAAVEQAMQEEPDWLHLARSALHKKFGALPPADRESRARRYRFLAQRGFSAEQINAALSGSADSE